MKTVLGLLDIRNAEEADFVYVNKAPQGTKLSKSFLDNLRSGKPAKSITPIDLYVKISDSFGGTKLPDFISNNQNLLIVSKRVRKIIEKHANGEVEYIPLSVMDREQKIVSKDYFIVNPIGEQDVLDKKATKLKKDPFGLGTIGFVMEVAKLKSASNIFRIKGHPTSYVISIKIATAIRKLTPKYKNLHYLEIYEY